MKRYKLVAHQKNFSEDELILCQRDFPHIKVKDIVEIYHPDYEGCRLLLQVQTLKDDMQKDTISVEQSIVSMFQLQIFSDVCVAVVDPSSVALDSVELTFKEQYLGRSDMWRLKDNLTGSCVYNNKKIEFCHKSVRCQVYEMWSQGEKVACGVVTDDTKIVFRSSTSQVYLFIQMSSEMWDFDIYGDLYFEKAVNGFLSELFAKWKRQGSNHEVTIVLFSRVFYEAESLDAFPDSMRACLQQDYRGKFYEDFYRVAVQSERLDDWACVLPQLKNLFHHWQTAVLAYHQQCNPDIDVPKGVNSSAAQGNFLEVLNMSLNVFEKHYLDRSFDRTGQLSVVITPGVGVFEVDRELTNITKQRIIDNGVGSDLVCVGEQPLHAVPLLQFHNKVRGITSNDFSMPHWINLSFYSSSKRVGYSTFIPRIKMAPIVNRPPNKSKSSEGLLPRKTSSTIKDESSLPNSVFDYDAYDAKVFAMPATRSNKVQTLMRDTRHRKTNTCSDISNRYDQRMRHRMRGRTSENEIPSTAHPGDGLSSSLISAPTLLSSSISKSMAIPKRSADDSSLLSYGATAPHLRVRRPSGGDEIYDERKFNPYRTVVGSAGSPIGRNGSQTNLPFESNFRQVKTGRALINPFDPSHVTIKLTSNRRRWTHIFPKGPTGVLIQQHHFQAVPAHEDVVGLKTVDAPHNGQNGKDSGNKERQKPVSRNSTLLWGATGEQEWTPALTTGVDWKSLTIPACLPITTDYFPDQRSLQNDFVVSDYSMIPDDVNGDYGQQRATGRRPLETREVFRELISQRLAQGFQLIMLPEKQSANDEEYLLSIGRIFHKIALKGSTITVTGYRPRHPYPTFRIHYRYRLQTPDHDTYDVSWVDFNAEKLENYNWNHLDHYICTRGDRDFALTESLKYWRLRLCILPNNMSDTPHTERVMRFLEMCVNRLKRLPKKPVRTSLTNVFRDRGGSNRIPDRPRLRSFINESKAIHQYPIGDSGVFVNHQPSPFHGDDILENVKVRITAGNVAIIDAMKATQGGLNFLDKSNNLPPYTFVSYEAISWLLEHVDGISNEREAIELMQKMVGDHLICHASGNTRIGFIYGFYLYTLVAEGFTPGIVMDNFDSEWAEVKIEPSLFTTESRQHGSNGTDYVSLKHAFLDKDPEAFEQKFRSYIERHAQMSNYKLCYLDMDISSKSNRIEWGHLRYQTAFYPDATLELIFQWVVCTGPLVAELVQNWLRKAQNCGINLVPMLCDPFALPLSHKADPLRAPIFVPLNLSAMSIDGIAFLDDYARDTCPQRLLLFQESIVRHFGFLPCSPDPASPFAHAPGRSAPPHQFIHTSGTSFLLILNSSSREPDAVPPSPQRTHRSTANWPLSSGLTSPSDNSLSLPTNYITRHVVTRHKWQQNQQIRLGFLWAWNTMLSKRWRNPAPGDETGSKLLADFRAFCANEKDRLKNFWQEARNRVEAYDSSTSSS